MQQEVVVKAKANKKKEPVSAKEVPKSNKSRGIKKPSNEVKKADKANDKRKNLKKFDKLKGNQPMSTFKSLLDIPATDIDGKQIKRLGDVLKGKKLYLIVNVATKCGLTKKTYTQMGDLYKKYADQGLEILAFPCNQFGSQEPGSREQIKAFARVHQNAKYLLFDKINVNGPNASEVFKFLRSNSELLNSEDQTVGHIHWNFGKFLVD